MKRFDTRNQLNNFIIKYDNSDSESMIMKVGMTPLTWYYADYYTFKPLCYYLTHEEIEKSL